MQKVVKLSTVQEPPSSPPYIASHITGKQLPNAKGSTAYLSIRVINSINSIDYNSDKEDTLSLQLKLSPILLRHWQKTAVMVDVMVDAELT